MLISEIVTYELDIDIPVEGTDVVLKSGNKFISKGEVLPLSDIFKAALFQANRQNVLKSLNIKKNITKPESVAEFYETCIEKATPFIYYFMDLDLEEQKNFFYMCMYDSYYSFDSKGGELFKKIVNREDMENGVYTYPGYTDKIKEISKIKRWKNLMTSIAKNNYSLGKNSGFAAILSLLDGENGFLKNFKVPEKSDFTKEKSTEIEAINFYTDLRPFMWDIFFTNLSLLENLGYEMEDLTKTALEDLLLKAKKCENVNAIVLEDNFYNIYLSSNMVDKDKKLIEFINENIDTPFFQKNAQLAYKMLDVLWKNKAEIVDSFPTNIFTKNLIIEDTENSKKVSFNVDAYLNLVKGYFALSRFVGEKNIFHDWEGNDFEGKYTSIPLLMNYADLKKRFIESNGEVGKIISEQEVSEWLHINENEKSYAKAIGKETTENLGFQELIENVLKNSGQKVTFKNTSMNIKGELGFFNVWDCEVEDINFKESFVKILKAIPFYEENSLIKVVESIVDEYLMRQSIDLKESAKQGKRLKF